MPEHQDDPVDMPPEGWGLHVQEIVCEWCGPLREESIYTHPDFELHSAVDGHVLTPEEFSLELHRNDHHTWNEETQTWTR